MQQFDIPIIHKTYEFYRALHDLQKVIPKMERFTLWQNCENTALQTLAGLLRVGYAPPEKRLEQLASVGINIDMLRVFLRLAVDIKALTPKKCLPLQEKLDEIGRMLGGWIKSLKQK
ncbi:MAG: diversity-generating retroelement protein Avd [Proteobacteria bacterium]|nr:MAG: diversity-generating retroelement protein Avd [Pseudomonadota bacterium]